MKDKCNNVNRFNLKYRVRSSWSLVSGSFGSLPCFLKSMSTLFPADERAVLKISLIAGQTVSTIGECQQT